jgi:hypothetical protein
MKRVFPIIFIAGVLFFASCNKLEQFNDLYIRLNLSSKSLWFNFDSTGSVKSFEISKAGNYLNIDSILKTNSVDTSKIQSVKIYKINFAIDTANGASKEYNFDFLKNMSISCKVDSPSFDFIDLGKVDSVKTSMTSFDMSVPNIEVKDIIRMDELLYRMRGWNKKPMGKTKVVVTVNYTVDAALSNK